VPSQILIADDNVVARNMLRTLLELQPDWKVCGEAANGKEAVQKAAELKPDIVILDLAMPVMDGLNAAREIVSSSPAVPILLHTNHCFPSLEMEAKKNGIREVVSKDAPGNELVNIVEKLLQPRVADGKNSDGLDERPDRDKPTPEDFGAT
jgi:NarL family two-component system response regulator LiaR